MKRVLLVNSNIEIFPYPVAPLGISLVASVLKNNYEVIVFDAAFGSTKDLIKKVGECKPHYIGIGIRNIDNVTMRKCKWYLDGIKEKIIDPLKKKYTIPIIAGGSGFSIAPVQIFEYLDVDYGVIGEAEDILPELLHTLDLGKEIKLYNVITRNQRSIVIKENIGNLLSLPKANIDRFIDFKPYSQRGSYPIQTKRGCSHQCIYCSYPNIEGHQYRLRPIHDIVDEIEEVQKRIPGVTFEFVDSTFNSPLNHALDVCKELINRGLKVKLRTMGINPGEVTEELILLMKKAGFTQMDCTPDSASEIMIKNYRKNFNKNKLTECAELIRKHDMPTMWFFMLGAPGETEETVKETFEFIDDYVYEKDMVHITEGIRIIPNTVLYDIAVNEGAVNKNDSVIEPMFYVSPSIGKERLTKILNKEINRRSNVLNSIDTTPPKELMQAAIEYRKTNRVEEPMFRTLLRLQNDIKIKAE